MVIYRVETTIDYDESSGYIYFFFKREAQDWLTEQRKKGDWWKWEDEPIEKIEFALTKKSIIAMMNQYASHPNNG